MNLSMNWLKEFVDINVSAKEFADAMTMSGSKVESFEEEGALINKVVVGKVLKIEQHPNADRLVVCQIDVGQSGPIQIVTGATNLKVGDVVPAALDGSVLTDGTKIKKGKLRGVLSQGMMCSLKELGLTINDFPYAIEDGIFVIQEDCEVGQDIRSALGFNDTKVEFEITSNRPDCFSMIGLAREAAATFNKKLKIHKPVLKNTIDDVNDLLSVKIEDSDLCKFYSARVVKDVKIGPSPRWLRERLRVMGVRPINNIVDITNYVMLEYGQPMHAFDLNLIDGSQIIVRRAQKGERIVTIDNSKIDLECSDLIIADKNKPLSLAGVMGGEFSSINSETTSVIFESANFDAESIRKSSRRHGLRTESSSRYEKGLDPNVCIPAIERACELIELIQAGTVVNGTAFESKFTNRETKINLDCDFINSFLSIDLNEDEMKCILEKIGCSICDDGQILVPSYRSDLNNKADIAEEIARFYGYDNIKSVSLKSDSQGKYTQKQHFEKKVVDTMTALGVDQIMTYSFIDPKNFDKLRVPYSSRLRDGVRIKNPLGETNSMMRTTAIPAMLETLSQNYNNKNDDVKLFEIAKEYIKSSDDELPEEKNRLTVGMYGKNFTFFDIKGILEELLDKLSIYRYDVEASNEYPEYHGGRCAVVTIDDTVAGTIGEVHPTVRENYEIGTPVYMMSIDMRLLFEKMDSNHKYKNLPKYPSVTRDLCLICDKDIPVASLVKMVSKAAGQLLENVRLFDVYSGEQIEKGKKSVAFNLTLRSRESTLTDEQILSVINKIIRTLEKSGITLRK